MFPCYGCHYMQRIFKTPWLRSEYVIKASSFWPLRGNFLIQLLPLEYTRSRAVRTHEELELATEASPGTGIFPPLGLHILTPVLFYFLLFFSTLSRSNQQTSCLHALLGTAQSLPILWTLDACLVILLPQKRFQLAREKYSVLPGSGPSFAWWERTGIIWYYHGKGLDGEALFGARSWKRTEEKPRHLSTSRHCVSVFGESQKNSHSYSRQIHILGHCEN